MISANATSFPAFVTGLIVWYGLQGFFNANNGNRRENRISFGTRDRATENGTVRVQAFEVCDSRGLVASVVLDLDGENAGRFTYSRRDFESNLETDDISIACGWMKEVLEKFKTSPSLAPPL